MTVDSRQSFISAIEGHLAAEPDNQDLAKSVLAGQSRQPCFVIGKNQQTHDLAKALKIEAIVQDQAEPGSAWEGFKIVGFNDLPQESIVINGSTSISPVAVDQRLQQIGGLTILNVNQLIHASGGKIPWPWFVAEQRQDWADHQGEWADIFEAMSDDVSRQTLIDILSFRLTADARHMAQYRVRLSEQYFEAFMNLSGEVFVDAGGYDGDTTEEFCRHDPHYKKVFLFEPSPQNIARARLRLKGLANIDFRSEGLSDQPGTLRFDAEAGSASGVSSTAEQTIEVTTLDLAVHEPVSLIKMDLEGWETKALAGCINHIKADRPKLALAAYHRASDFRDLLKQVRSYRNDYRVYLRHYTQGWSETVMFFI
jgi:FkbM family methyltransferase